MIIYYHMIENLITPENLEKNKTQLRTIFTEIQLKTLRKKLEKKNLTSNEKTYYYKYIKPKLRAMLSFLNIQETSITGKQCIIQKRIPKAINTLKKIQKKHKKKKILISGSYLFNKNYKDIDVFIFTKYQKKDYSIGKIHINFMPESALSSLFFASLSKISISNFSYTVKKDFNIQLSTLLQNYELAINHLINKEDCQKELRTLILEQEYISKKIILNPEQLYKIKSKLKSKKLISSSLINTLIIAYKKEKIRQKLAQCISTYKKLLKRYKNAENISTYIKTYKQVINLAHN